MKKIITSSLCSIFLLLLLVPGALLAQGQNNSILVGRIAYVEGQLLRYVPEEKEWVATVKDVPFGLEEALFEDLPHHERNFAFDRFTVTKSPVNLLHRLNDFGFP